MKYETKLQLAAIHNVCDQEDKSTEWMIQYMQDALNLSHDAVMSYLQIPEKELHEIRMVQIRIQNVGATCWHTIRKTDLARLDEKP